MMAGTGHDGAAVLGVDGTLSDASPILIVTDDHVAGAAIERLVGPGAVACRVGWADAAAAITEQPRLAAVLVDATGVTDQRVAALLGDVVGAAGAMDARVVAGFGLDQIDHVAGPLLGQATLLCEPDPAAWAVEIALATADPGLVVHDTSREDDRYRRLSEEVARLADALAGLGQQAQLQPGGIPAALGDPYVSERPLAYGAPPAIDVDPAEIRRAIRARRMRDDAFGIGGLFEDPAWDMLLDLFAAELERQRVSVSSLCIAAAVAPTTALRWIGKLVDAGLLERRPDDFDRRRAFLSLTARASTAMRNYVAAIRRAGLAVA